MKINEARPLFRVLAGLISIVTWFAFGFTVFFPPSNFSSAFPHFGILLGMFIGAVSFSYVAISGYMPKLLLRMFAWGTIASDDDLK